MDSDFTEEIKSINVCIDSTTLRGSQGSVNGKSAVNTVSAWADHVGLVFGQLITDAKSNEITTISELIKTLCLEIAVLTIDAMGCQ